MPRVAPFEIHHRRYDLLRETGFTGSARGANRFHTTSHMRQVEPLRIGTGTGAFVIVRAVRPPV